MLVLGIGRDFLFWCPAFLLFFLRMFEHERLEVYGFARELNREICRLTKVASAGPYDHVNQIVRAGRSLTRNIAEGSGEWSPKEKAKFYRYAKRSGAECAASLDVLVDYEMLREADIKHAKELLRRVIPMLVNSSSYSKAAD